MPNVTLPTPTEGKNTDETVKNLIDVVFKLRKELEFLLYNLDETNVLKAKTAEIAELYAGTIEANKITTVNAKIGTAQIETLTVGGNVAMGSNATISWQKVTDQPTIPSQYTDAMALASWVASAYKTYIDANGVYTGTVAANKILIGGENGSLSFTDLSNKPNTTYIDANGIYTGTINANKVNAGTLTGFTIQTDNVDNARIVIDATSIRSYNSDNELSGIVLDPEYSDLLLYFSGVEFFKIYNDGAGGVQIKGFGHDMLSFNNNTEKTYPLGAWDFSSVTVSGFQAVWG